MPPKAKPAAKGKAAAKAAPAPAETPPPPAVEEKPPPSVSDVEAHLAQLPEDDWAELGAVEDPAPPVARALESVLVLLGHPNASAWPSAKSALSDHPALLRQLKALGPWGASDAQVEAASVVLQASDVRQLERPGTAEVPAASAGSRAGAAAKAKAPPAKAKAKAPAAKAKAAPATPPPPDPGASAALALGMLAQALVAMRKADKPPPFPMVWPVVPYFKLHSMLQTAMLNRQVASVLCEGSSAYGAAILYFEKSGSILVNITKLQVRVGLAKTLSLDGMRAEIGHLLREAMATGRRCALLVGDCPPNMRHLCDAKQLPMEAFDGEKSQEAAQAMDLSGAVAGFHLTIVAQASKEQSSMLARLLPGFDEMAVLLLDPSSLPAADALRSTSDLGDAPSLSSALRLLALQPPSGADAGSAPTSAAAAGADSGATWNNEDFEYLEAFGEDYTQRWSTGPATNDENGKPIRAGLINAQLVKYPSNPKDAKNCMQLMGGAPNAPCTGIWTSFSPIARPTEVEFEFTINGKVDLPNACMVFTEKQFEGALPDCKIGLQFLVRGGMQLAGGSGNLVRISNDGKIKNDKWNKVIIKIDWNEKICVAQVDTQGKGYAPAVQTVPFRDPNCQGFGFCYIYNTDVQGTSWFHSLRVKQAEPEFLDTEALDARAHFAMREKQKQYEMAVAADMEVGMKMGAIKCTAQHGMNLAQEQAANSGSAAGAAMGR